jgi:hypothetical protein
MRMMLPGGFDVRLVFLPPPRMPLAACFLLPVEKATGDQHGLGNSCEGDIQAEVVFEDPSVKRADFCGRLSFLESAALSTMRLRFFEDVVLSSP